MWDLAGAYASMGRLLIHYEEADGVAWKDDFRNPLYEAAEFPDNVSVAPPVSAGAVWLTLEALLKVNRPDEESGWESFSSSRQVAWKTGTSFGFRDAWAVGLSRDFLVAVWCGNADGEGRPGLTGTMAAAPLMFNVFGLLPAGKWFTPPVDEMTAIPVCRESGCRIGPYCGPADTILVMNKGLNTEACPYHRLVHLDHTGRWQVTSTGVPVAEMVHRPWFVLPPVMEWYYKRQNPFYRPLSPFHPECPETPVSRVLEMIYPQENDQVFVPVQLDGSPGQVILEAAHSSPDAVIYWHLDEDYIGQTSGSHQMAVNFRPGTHKITLVDNQGNQLMKSITVITKQ
jgi:penicillin-binding protein 1C